MSTSAPALPPAHTTRPHAAVRHLTDAAPVSPDELAVLWDAARQRYRNTYGPEGRSRTWRARVVKNVNLPGRYGSDREAAKAVVRWFRAWFGPGWVRAFRAMRANRVTVKMTRRGGGCRAWVYVGGEAVPVGEFGGVGAARAAVRKWLADYRAAHGAYWRLLLWRA